MVINSVHPEISPPEIPSPEIPPLHPGTERPEIVPPDSLPIDEPVIVDQQTHSRDRDGSGRVRLC